MLVHIDEGAASPFQSASVNEKRSLQHIMLQNRAWYPSPRGCSVYGTCLFLVVTLSKSNRPCYVAPEPLRAGHVSRVLTEQVTRTTRSSTRTLTGSTCRRTRSSLDEPGWGAAATRTNRYVLVSSTRTPPLSSASFLCFPPLHECCSHPQLRVKSILLVQCFKIPSIQYNCRNLEFALVTHQPAALSQRIAVVWRSVVLIPGDLDTPQP